MNRSIQGDWYRIEFSRCGDRIGHAVFVAASFGGDREPRWVELLRSIESTAEVDWPESPPLQELHIEPRSGGDVALLVGKAGRSHWSASIVGQPAGCGADLPAEASSLAFDIAARVSSSPAVLLRSSYQLGDDVRLMGREPATMDAGAWRSVSLVADGDHIFELAVDGSSVITVMPDTRRLTIRPASTSAELPATFRWRFTLGGGAK